MENLPITKYRSVSWKMESRDGVEYLWEPAVIGDYVLKSKLGENSISTVWRAEHSLTGEEAAVKRVDLSKLNRHLRSCLDCELAFLSSVKHPNIICLRHAFQDGDFLIMVFEYCGGGTLGAYIQHHGGVKENVARRFMQQIGAGLEIIHANNIIHRDLKPEEMFFIQPYRSCLFYAACLF